VSAAHDIQAPRFVLYPRHRWAQCYCARAGSWTFRNLYVELYGSPYAQPAVQTHEQLLRAQLGGALVAWFVRQPHARFASVYHHFKAKQLRWARDGINFPKTFEMAQANYDGRLFESIDIFAERALACFPDDKHIAPQVGTFGEIPELIAPLYRAAEAWEIMKPRFPRPVPATLPINNSNGAVPIENIPDSVRKFYAADTEFWRGVCENFQNRSAKV
jgi:hypothetical protein